MSEWVTVPVEPTREMAADGWNEGLRHLSRLAGITPTSIRKRSAQATLDFASSQPAGADAE